MSKLTNGNIFFKYYEKEEQENGAYWKYLDITSDDELNLGLNLYRWDIYYIITNNIKNPELKLKMTDQLKSLIRNSKTLSFDDEKVLFKLFTIDELKEIIVNVIQNFNIDNVDVVIDVILKFDDNYIDWKREQLDNIFGILIGYHDDRLFIKCMKSLIGYTELHTYFVDKYRDKLPKEYFLYFKIKSDSKFIVKLQKEKLKTSSCIGIDPNIKIGVEIEVDGNYPFSGFLTNQEGVSYRDKIDPTVPTGIEVVTKSTFHDTEEDISMFEAICDTMGNLGYYYDELLCDAGGQINLGLDYLDSAQSILIFYEIFLNCEELLWYISNEKGQIARCDIFENERMHAISEIIGKRVLDEDITREEVIKLFNARYDRNADIKEISFKEDTVCLRGETEDDYRFEFRIPNGGCHAKTWIDNIRLYGKIMEISKRLANIMVKKEDLTEEEERLLGLKIDLQKEDLSLEEKLDILMDLLFDDENIKDIYFDRFYSTIEKIRETRTDRYINFTAKKVFSEVEFQGQYGKANDSDDIYLGRVVASYDPDSKIGRKR